MGEKKKIMLVEDDAFIGDIYSVKLKNAGFEAIATENGLEAMKLLEKDAPDLVLLDITMPYMDGTEVLKKMKENERWKKIPVVILSNISEKEKVDEALESGADDYILKSHFTPSEVMEKINSILLKR